LHIYPPFFTKKTGPTPTHQRKTCPCCDGQLFWSLHDFLKNTGPRTCAMDRWLTNTTYYRNKDGHLENKMRVLSMWHGQ
jgi:hypothetical protein